MKTASLVVALALLLTACGGPAPPTPAAVLEPTPTWAAYPEPPEQFAADKPPGEVTLTREEGQAILPVRLVGRRGSSEAGFQGTQLKYIIFQVEFKNNTKHDIAKASGTILFNDKEGYFLDGDKVDELPKIRAGETVTISHRFLDTESVKVRATLRETPLNDLSVKFQPYFISFADGTGQEITYEK